MKEGKGRTVCKAELIGTTPQGKRKSTGISREAEAKVQNLTPAAKTISKYLALLELAIVLQQDEDVKKSEGK